MRGRLCIRYLLFAPRTVKLKSIESCLLVPVKGFKHEWLASALWAAVGLEGAFLAERSLTFLTLGRLVDNVKANTAVEV